MLLDGLQFAVPLHILEVHRKPFSERQRLAREAAAVVGGQGDTLMYGSASTRFGDGAKETARHRAHGTAKTDECASCPRGKKREAPGPCCGARFKGCGVCTRGQATYSAGEVFDFLARGLAIAACQPGGVTFAGLHWCAWPHPCCPSVRTARRPGCCTCTDACLLAASCTSPPAGSECADGCPFCGNGCATSTGQACCTPAPPPPPEQEPPSCGWRPDDEYGPLVEDVTVAGSVL